MSEVIVRQRSGLGAWVIVLAVLAAIVALIIWHPWGSAGRAPRAMPPSPVGIAAAGTSDMPVIDAGLGTVTPLATVTVQSQIAGIMQTIGFTEGQMVHRGDFLAQIDPRPYQALLDQARGTLAHDQGLLAQAQTDLKRYATLNRQDSISRQQVDDQRFLVQQYQGSVAADQGAVQTQMVNIAFCHIVSPVDGRVGLRQIDPGNYVTTSETNGIVVVTQLQPISVIFTVPEDAITAIQKRLAAGAKLSVAAWDRSDTTLLATGTLETIDNQIDTTTGTVKLRAIFDNAAGLLFPNQFVNARLLVDTVKNAITIPNAGLQSGAPGNFVYLLNADDTVSVRPVKVGIADSNLTQITSGLNVGDKIVIDGADRLRDGMHVMVPRAGPPGADAGTAPAHHRHKPGAGE
jgi:multidrug efflux system membrane fusion protein